MVDATRTLPRELLEMVFTHAFALCKDDASRSRTRAFLCATCSRWRGVALNSRILWSSIYLDTRFAALWPAIIDTNLERSGACSLTLTVVEPWQISFPDIDARLATVLARTRVFTAAGCLSDTICRLSGCFSSPAPELETYIGRAVDAARNVAVTFFPAAPKLKVLYGYGFRLRFPGPLPALACVSLDMHDLDALAVLSQRAPHIEDATLRIHAALPPHHLRFPALLKLDLTCLDAASALALHCPALKTAIIKLTRPGVVDLRDLTTFAQRNGARLLNLNLSFSGDLSRLAAALAHCGELVALTLGEIGWSTSYVASFLLDMAVPDGNGNWVCGRLQGLKLRVVQLESAVRTALIELAEARHAGAPEGERPERPLRFVFVVRSDDSVDMTRRTKYAALNKRLSEILGPQNI